jgi:ubiquinone/menaquinone biosynthesis C-methylase UbiE
MDGSMQRQILLDAFGVPKGLWGQVGGRLMGAFNRPINELTVDLLDVGPRDRVLEIGNGPGTALALVGARVSDGLVVGIDPSAVMARQAYRRNRALIRRGRLRLTLGSSDRLPFAAGRFDRMFTVNTIYFWPTPQNDLAEMHRVLKSGGRAAVTFRGKRGPSGALSVRTLFDTEYSIEQVAAMLTAVGFRAVETTVRQLPFMTAVCLLARA